MIGLENYTAKLESNDNWIELVNFRDSASFIKTHKISAERRQQLRNKDIKKWRRNDQ